MAFVQNASYGQALLSNVSNQIGTLGNIFVVCNSTDSADPQYQMLQQIFTPDTYGLVRFYTDIATAYAATTSGNNDVIILSSHTSHKVASMLTISNNAVHFIGMGGNPRKIGARTLISNTGAGASTDVSMVKITGRGCSFHNIKFSNNWTVSQNLSAVLDYANNTYMENCDIENLGSAHLTNNAAGSLILAGGECIYKNCTIGQDTLLITSTGGQQLLISKGTSAQAATRCIFENCNFHAYTSDTTHVFVRVADSTSVDRYVNFDNCTFQNVGAGATSGVTLAVGFATPSSMAGQINVFYPRMTVTTKIGSAAVGNTGLYLVSPTIVATTAVGLQTT